MWVAPSAEQESKGRRRVITIGILWVFQPLNVARHIPHLRSEVYAHFGPSGEGVPVSRMPLAGYTFVVVLLSALLALAVAATTRHAFRTAATRTAMDVTWHRQVVSAHAVFGLGLLALCCANLAVWAALEANEERPPRLPPADSCDPCRIFIPVYTFAVAGMRWLLLSGLLCATTVGFLLWPACNLRAGEGDQASTEAEREGLVAGSPGRPYTRIDTVFEQL
eukprot:COSAG05_NODE_181_length_14767_cov_9.554859_7_plen_222_part_00